MARVYEDFSILALCWEATFFSKNHLTKSREILNENPKLPHHLVKVESILKIFLDYPLVLIAGY